MIYEKYVVKIQSDILEFVLVYLHKNQNNKKRKHRICNYKKI